MKTRFRLLRLSSPAALVSLLIAAPLAQAQYAYTTNDDGISITITGYTGTSLDLIIPTNINTLLVTAIGTNAFSDTRLTSVSMPGSINKIEDYAFDGCLSLTNISIPNSVTTIGVGAFESCNSLTSIAIPSAVTGIPDIIFEYCLNLTNVSIPDRITSIGAGAFEECSLAGVSIPASVTNIGYNAFNECPAAITVDPQNALYSSINGVLFDKNQTTLIRGVISGRCVVPSTVNSIADFAFAGTELTGVTIPDSVTSIGDSAFTDTALTSVTIPGSVASIGNFAFGECLLLTNVTMGDGVTFILKGSFNGCYNLHRLTIPASVAYIEDSFWFCHLSLYFEGPPPFFQEAFYQGTSPRFYSSYFLPRYGITFFGLRPAFGWYPEGSKKLMQPPYSRI